MNITFAQYTVDISGNFSCINATIDGQQMFIPLDPANRHYDAILKAVENGDLVIEEAQP